MLAKVGPASVFFVVADGIDSNANEKREAKPDQSTPCSVKVLVVPNTGLEPSSDLIQSPHGADEHGTGVPALSDHAGDDESDDTREEGTPIADVAVIALFGRDAQLVNHANRVEVIDGASERKYPHAECNHERHGVSVETVLLPEEGKPTFLASGVQGAPSKNTSEQARCREHRPVGKEHVSGGLAFEVHGRDQLAAFHGVLRRECSKGVACGGHGEPEADSGERHGGHPFVAPTQVQV